MQKLWTFPKSTENTLIFIKDKTIYVDQKKGDELKLQTKNIEAQNDWKLPNGIHFATIQKVYFHKNKMEIHQKDSKKTLFIDDSTKSNEIFSALKEGIPTLKYSATRPSIMSQIGIQLPFTILVFISLIYYLFEINEIGRNLEVAALQEAFGTFYGNFIYGISSLGFIGIFIIGLTYIQGRIILLNLIF
ncbi:hypothetical protein IMCC3317_21340 [Kordia antarctica]|uniref:Uncharacterized protein n=1 Tax=Kordia antarctica TaxID=1218801 RepID=A0A7L4ZLE1_9FLAO|nr:hypothetical protein [Kordia antarctica]QHI36764.1 hypothetical protein IMCC3317_21340 [Kordia antarctica]